MTLFQALVDSFVEFDRTLTSRKVVAELKKLAGTETDDDDHDPGENGAHAGSQRATSHKEPGSCLGRV